MDPFSSPILKIVLPACLKMKLWNFVLAMNWKMKSLNAFRKIKLQKFLNEEIIKTFWVSFNLRVLHVHLRSTVTICRDPKDNFLLALSKDAEADFLITGDKDLLELEKFGRTIICTLNDFIQKHFQK